MTPKVSIIVPVYNGEKYIQTCIEQIFNQSYTNFELLIINDGSTDDTLNILSNTKNLNNKNINIFNKANGGVSSARNLGIEKAHGQWIAFIDADDIITQNYLSDLMLAVDQDNSIDLNISGFKSFGSSTNLTNSFNNETITKDQIGLLLSKQLKRTSFGTLWGKIYKKEIIINNNIKFDTKIRFNEDTLFNLRYFLFCHKIKTIKSVNYLWRIDERPFSRYAADIDEYIYTLRLLSTAYNDLTQKYSFTNNKYIEGVFMMHTFRLMTYEMQHNKYRLTSYNYFKHRFKEISDLRNYFRSSNKSIISILFYFIRHNNIFPFFLYSRFIYPLKLIISTK